MNKNILHKAFALVFILSALLLGFTQCKKEQIEPQGGKVSITLNVENGASTGSATDGASTGSGTGSATVRDDAKRQSDSPAFGTPFGEGDDAKRQKDWD